MIQTLPTDTTELSPIAELSSSIPQYINAAKTQNTIRVHAEASNGIKQQIFDILLDAGSPIKPRIEQLLAGWQILDWMPDGAF